MGCTTLLVGRLASNDGSTIIARNDDASNGTFAANKMVVVKPSEQPKTYTSKISHLTIKLPDKPLRYTCMPNVDQSERGIWGEAGINSANVAMTATETISSNPRVLGADPLVEYKPAVGTKGKPGYVPEQPGGIGEEDLVTIILPYIKSAREGVQRMGSLLEKYGTYEMNGVAFADEKEVWYIETIGGHHWIARRVPDDCYVAQPNRQGIDMFDLSDAFGCQDSHMCSADLAEWMDGNHLCMEMEQPGIERTTIQGFLRRDTCNEEESDEEVCGSTVFNARLAFGSKTWHDIRYNTARKWYMCKILNPSSAEFNGVCPKYGPQSFDMPWAVRPENKISVADVKDLLSTTYDGTEYNPYSSQGTKESRSLYRVIGINRTNECSIMSIRPYAPYASQAVQWVCMGSGPFNTALAVFTNVDKLPGYLDTNMRVSTDSLYWTDRLIAALADSEFADNYTAILDYQQKTMAEGYEMLRLTDAEVEKLGKKSGRAVASILEEANQRLADSVKAQTDQLLSQVLYTRSMNMGNAFRTSDH